MPDHLARLRPGVRRRRAATWDRTGGNADFVVLPPGGSAVLAQDRGPGQVTHLWFTLRTADLWWGRHLVLRAWWDGEPTPSVQAPLGDFLGAGNALVAPFSSALLEAAPQDGMSLHCWFPMPFADGFRIEVGNDGPLPVPALYAHVDYELWPEADLGLGRFHATWHRERRTPPAGPPGTYAFGTNLSGDDNYQLLDARGRGHFVGSALYVQSDLGGWYGEGDDMLFVDGDVWPPTVHGTGTEDCYGTAWSPSTAFSHPYYGQPVAERDDWAGFSSLYRFHVADPVPFERSLRATIEHGHANDRGDDWSSVAYWYQLDRSAPLPELPPVVDREPPWPPAWRDRVLAVREVFLGLGDDDPRAGAAAAHLTRLVLRRDGAAVDRALAWLRGEPTPVPVPEVPALLPLPLDEARGLDDDALQGWAAGVPGLVELVLRDWVARFDAVEARSAQAVVGVRVGEQAWQLVVGGGRCRLRAGADGPERLTVVADAATLLAWTLGRLDPWEALLRGDLRLLGDGDLAHRLAGLFPQPSGAHRFSNSE